MLIFSEMAAIEVKSPYSHRHTQSLDLSGRENMKFEEEVGKCYNCGDKRPLLKEIKWCKICIMEYLPLKSLGITRIIAPTNYKKADAENKICIVCLDDTDGSGHDIITCANCRCKYCHPCFQLLHKDDDGYTKCIHCGVNKLKVTYQD